MTKTLYIGLGGLGTRVVSKIKSQQCAASGNGSWYVVLDRDNYDLFNRAQKDKVPFVSMGLNEPLHYYIDLFKTSQNIEEWFPTSPAFLHSVVENIGMIRAAGRLAFLYAIESGRLDTIENMLNEMINGDNNLQVVIITSLAGGTGSGTFIQLALWIRNHFAMSDRCNYNISGLLVGPEVFIDSFRGIMDNRNECEVLRGNTYAALKELEVITKIKKGTAALSLSNDLHLDGLLNNFVCQTESESVFDKIYIYDSLKSSKDINESFDKHIDNIAKLLCLNFDSVATDSFLQIERYIKSSTLLKGAYLQMCERAKQLSLSYYNPHIDKRWAELLNNEH